MDLIDLNMNSKSAIAQPSESDPPGNSMPPEQYIIPMVAPNYFAINLIQYFHNVISSIPIDLRNDMLISAY